MSSPLGSKTAANSTHAMKTNPKGIPRLVGRNPPRPCTHSDHARRVHEHGGCNNYNFRQLNSRGRPMAKLASLDRRSSLLLAAP